MIPGLSPPPGNYANPGFVKRSLPGQIGERLYFFLLIQVWPVDNRQAILPLPEGQLICVFGA